MIFSDKIKQEIAKLIGTADKKFKIDPLEIELPPNSQLGDFAWPCFKLSKEMKKAPNVIAQELAGKIKVGGLVESVKAVGPYVNFFLNKNKVASDFLSLVSKAGEKYGDSNLGKKEKVLVEYSGPNTNKPQHVGHARNNMLGYSLSLILEAVGYKVVKVNIVNDRGIHICKSMLAWQKWGKGETPKSSGLKGDHLVGKYYVMFGQELAKEEKKYLEDNKIKLDKLGDQKKRKVEDDFLKQSPLMKEAREMLKKWEAKDKGVRALWQKMNSWVYEGYKKTYGDLGISFDKTYYESETYIMGRKFVEEGIKKGIFYREPDGSAWIDLTKDGLDKKLLIRSDGTAVYMTQDLGTANQRYKDYKFDRMVYVVGSEQEYHFKVLFLILNKLGFKWAKNLHHLSYGMISLPGGKIKSREGKTADADDLISEVIAEADKVTRELLKKREPAEKMTDKEIKEIARKVGLAGLKFFLLKFDPRKDIVFKPEESITFEGFTGPYLQYTYTRIASIFRKAKVKKVKPIKNITLKEDLEWELVKSMMRFPIILESAAQTYNPSLLANYLFDLAKQFAGFYEQVPIIQADQEDKNMRLYLINQVGTILKRGLNMLGIDVMERM